ncbi:hypothetical protein Ssi02_29430 [Sinosporangium siamense]|uniref:Uncharacterized protein n=1 Tax=Sinosporangium siamense TaxID=1367973 RepID=A0A919RG10_9ACTN|nr:hypothetical protein Ssi02_29430 [Sinosporangium siamense]
MSVTASVGVGFHGADGLGDPCARPEVMAVDVFHGVHGSSRHICVTLATFYFESSEECYDNETCPATGVRMPPYAVEPPDQAGLLTAPLRAYCKDDLSRQKVRRWGLPADLMGSGGIITRGRA